MSESSIWAVIPAGGSGSRYSQSGEDKLLADLAGQPVLRWSLQALLQARGLSGIVLAVAEARMPAYEALARQWFPQADILVVAGGADRRQSVYHGLLALPEEAAIVAVHDAARPLIRTRTIEAALQAVLAGAAGAVVAVPMHDTVKQAEGESISATLDRTRLWRAQTPQVFRKDLLLRAHRMIPVETPVTDDAQLMELAGLGPVVLVPGEEGNLKITTRADLRLAEAYLAMDAPLAP
jgi:2-C-methyl-D-erythritol 4-phosphate cytidylyltransferase